MIIEKIILKKINKIVTHINYINILHNVERKQTTS